VFNRETLALTSANLPNVADLPRGHEFSATRFRLGADDVRRYLEAVEDRSNAYGHGPEGPAWVPPLAVAALALRAVLEQVELPAGALHAGQEVEFRRPVPVGASLRLQARVAQRSEMRGAVVSVIEFDVRQDGSTAPAVVGRATVIVPPGKAPL
jgi:N-terminal half of MaoC dehydratase